mgnify:CR=1 FL=1
MKNKSNLNKFIWYSLVALAIIILILVLFIILKKDSPEINNPPELPSKEPEKITSYSLELKGKNEQIIFLGALSRDDVAKWMNKCDCFVLPSRYETFGVVYIEALASGRPVIGALNGGAEDIINNLNGYLVPIDDIDKLAEKMLEM